MNSPHRTFVEKEGDGLRRWLYVLYCPRSNPRLTQYTHGSCKPQQNYGETSGLTHFLLVIATMLFFVLMEAPLWGMQPSLFKTVTKSKSTEEFSERTSEKSRLAVNETTEQKRREIPGAEADGSDETLFLDDSPPQRRNPKRLSSERFFLPPLPFDRLQCLRLLSTTLTPDRKQAEEEVDKQRSQLVENFRKKQSSLQAEQQLAKEAILKQQKMRQHFESFYVTQGLPGLPYRLYLSEEKNIAEKTLNHHQLVVSSQEKLTNYSTELKWLLSYLPKRNVLLEKTSSSRPSSSEENHQLQTLVEEKLTQTQQIGQSILNSICTFDITTIAYNQLDALSNEQLALINNVISLVRNMQLFFLGYHSSAFVTMNKEQLAEVEEGLKSKIQELDQDAFLNSDVTLNSEIKDCYLAAQTLLENSKAELLLMETSSSRETGLAATKNIINISEAAQKIEEAKTATESEIEESDHKEALGNEIIKMEALHFLLLNAILSYRAIEDESWIEKKCGNLNKLYDQITATIPTITQQANALTNLNIEHLSTRLRDLLDAKNFKLDKPLEVPQGPLEFLDELSSLDNDLLQKRIIGTHGKIALDDAPDTSIAKSDVTYTDQTRREWTSGINLIRLAICRTYGIQVKNIFDSRFFVKRREENSLKVREVINFLFHKNHEPKYHSSFFIDPKMSHEDFLKMLSAVHHNSNIASNKVIKIDQATLDFNPFSKKPLDLPNESISAADLRQREAAFQYTRQALEKAFPEMFLTKEQMNEVLEKFDAQFKVIPKGILLSLEKAHAFIEREREILKARSYWKKYVMRYLGQEAMQNMLNGLYYSIGAHLLPFALGILSYLYYLSVTHNLS